MKKATLTMLCLLMIISTAFCLEGCKSREQRLSEETAYEDAQMNAMNKKLNTLMKKIKKVSRSFFQRVHKRISKI